MYCAPSASPRFSQRRRQLGLLFSGFLLGSSFIQGLAPSSARALDILNFDLASSASRAVVHPPVQTSTVAVSLASSIQPISFSSPSQPEKSATSSDSNGLALRDADGPQASPQTSPQNREKLLFEGGAHSLVAVAVGNAEGTRTARGDRTPAYSGHIDPGNGAWNQGSFSYQHPARSPEEADQKQLARLSTQAADLRQQAQAQGMGLTLLEELSGIDLANQAPLAALEHGGYIDWLQEAKRRQLAANEAIIWARTWSYWDPQLNSWNAPGLGNHWDSIYADQERRHWAVVQASKNFRL